MQTRRAAADKAILQAKGILRPNSHGLPVRRAGFWGNSNVLGLMRRTRRLTARTPAQRMRGRQIKNT
jgi:hypothetical protein